jgi:hypothetical protein
MTSKALRAGGEVDSWCTKCRHLLNHRIVAVDKGKPVKVECLTCRGIHAYRATAPGQKAAASEASPRASKASGGSSTSSSSAPKASRGAAAARAEQAEMERTKTWEKAIAGRSTKDFRPYQVTQIFGEGELVRHSRFGDGVVMRVLDAKKIEVLFQAEAKVLAQNLTD